MKNEKLSVGDIVYYIEYIQDKLRIHLKKVFLEPRNRHAHILLIPWGRWL